MLPGFGFLSNGAGPTDFPAFFGSFIAGKEPLAEAIFKPVAPSFENVEDTRRVRLTGAILPALKWATQRCPREPYRS